MIGLLRMLLLVLQKFLVPRCSSFAATLSQTSLKVAEDSFRNKELCVFGPAVVAFSELDLFFAEGLAMCAAGVLFVRSTVADVTVDDDQSRSVAGLVERSECAL